MSHRHARAVADAVLFEGYALYPYRKSSLKNQRRWLFGVLAPRAFAESDGSEAWWMQTECLVEGEGPASLSCELRFLRQRRRQVEARGDDGAFHPVESLELDGRRYVTWDEGEVHGAELALAAGAAEGRTLTIELAADRDEEPIRNAAGELAARVIRERGRVSCSVQLRVAKVEARSPLSRLTIRVENLTPCASASPSREEALAGFLEGTHLLLSLDAGNFVSLLEPPEWAEAAAAACKNVRAFPVLAGDAGGSGVVLASPIILYDHPQIAPESQGDFFDSTEIDELLTLRTRAMTDAEKREARALDPRVAAIVDRVDAIDDDSFARLHGALRDLGGAPRADSSSWLEDSSPLEASRDALDASSAPPTLAVGARVRLRPGKRRTDAQDMFLDGMSATIRAVLRDVDEREYFAVTVDDDPASELNLLKSRFLYFYPDEVAPLTSAA